MRRPTVLQRATLLSGIVLTALVTDAKPATASGYALTSRTAYFGSQVRLYPDKDDPRHDQLRDLNRFSQWIDARIWELGDARDIDTVMSVRFDHDFGTGFRRDTPEGLGIPATDEHADLTIAYLYVDWRNVISGRLDLRFGRQLILDDLDWYPLDGVKATVHPVRHVTVEVYAGRSVPFDQLSASDVFVNDGISVADGENFAYGGAVAGSYAEVLSYSLAYRTELVKRGDDILVYGRDPTGDLGRPIQAGSGGKLGVQEQLLGASLGYTIREIATDLYAQGTWNLIAGDLDQARAGVGFNPSANLHAGLEYLRVRPRFAADSIFNWFNIFPYDRVRSELTWRIRTGLTLKAGYFWQRFNGGPNGPRLDEPDPAVRGDSEGAEFAGSSRVHGPSAGLTYQASTWTAGVFGESSTNISGRVAYGGSYRRIEAFGTMSFMDDRLQANLRSGFTGFQNDWFESSDAGAVQPEDRSVSVDAGVRARITDTVTARLNYLRRFDSLLEGDYRIYSLVEVRY